MKEKKHWLQQDDILTRLSYEVNNENRIALKLLSIAGISLSIISFITQLLTVGFSPALMKSVWLPAVFFLFMVVERFILPKDYPHCTLVLYLLETPLMIVVILLGTVWDPTHQAVTILLFLIAMPAFMLDRPTRILAFMAGWAIVFLVICFHVKERSLFYTDATHIVEFYLATAALNIVILRVRLESLKRLEETQYHLTHDRETACLNRYALASQTSRYVGRAVAILLFDLDRFKMYHDYYGHSFADKMIQHLAATLTEHFGKENTFRYGQDEFLCAAFQLQEEECPEHVEDCRRRLHAFEAEGQKIPLHCSIGYVTGNPKDADDFHKMIQLADIYAHKVKRTGPDQSQGSVYDPDVLRQAIGESNLSLHSGPYEVDRLTGIPGMSFFIVRSDELLQNVVILDRQPVIGHFKLLNMRGYNNEFGYEQGDELIAYTARLLQKYLKGRLIGHITSGQFAFLCYRNEAVEMIGQVSEALLHVRPGFQVRCRLGLAEYSGKETSIFLLDKAKIAQKSIIHDKERIVCLYNTTLDEELRFRQHITNHLDEAIDKGYLKVYYQPIARSLTGEICEEEALSRWDDPEYGFLLPFRFIPPLEESSLMYKVNLHVVRQVLKDLRKKQEVGISIVPISVNLSRKDFDQCDMVQEITDLVDQSGFPRSMIHIEITESAFISGQDKLKREVARFRANGFEVWMDDFGSEYSTLNLLQEIDFDLIKIDMQFMKNFSEEGKNYIIVSEIIDMARRMGIATLIEGIESWEHFRIMKKLGCEKIQGFLFNRPNPLDYILDRFLSGTGLTFEKSSTIPYLASIGRIDLNSPLKGIGLNDPLQFDQEMPAGIVEQRQEEVVCLRWNDSFISRLKMLDLAGEEETDSRFYSLKSPLPDSIVQGIRQAGKADEWIIITERTENITVYLRKIDSCASRNSTAFLMLLIRSRKM